MSPNTKGGQKSFFFLQWRLNGNSIYIGISWYHQFVFQPIIDKIPNLVHLFASSCHRAFSFLHLVNSLGCFSLPITDHLFSWPLLFLNVHPVISRALFDHVSHMFSKGTLWPGQLTLLGIWLAVQWLSIGTWVPWPKQLLPQPTASHCLRHTYWLHQLLTPKFGLTTQLMLCQLAGPANQTPIGQILVVCK